MRNYTLALRLLTAFLAVTLILGMPIIARAQDSTSSGSQDMNNKPVTLNLNNADIRSALKLLFDTVGVNFTLDSSVRGYVTVSLNNVPFRAALDSILRSSSMIPLTYRVENGVYNISPKEQDNTQTVDNSTSPTDNTTTQTDETKKPSRIVKIGVNFADASDIAYVLGGYTIPTRYSNMSMMGGYGSGFGGGYGGGGFGNSFGNGYGNSFGGGFGNNSFGGGFGNNSYGGFGNNSYGGFGNNSYGGGFGNNSYGGYGGGYNRY